jgi:glycine cleavage system H protein
MKLKQYRQVEVDGQVICGLWDGHYYRYTTDHLWTRLTGGCPCHPPLVGVGVTEFIRYRQGPVREVQVFCSRQTLLAQGMEFARLETGRGTLVLRCPLEGMVVVANARLQEKPALISEDPYAAGWLLLVRPADIPGYRESLLDADAYVKWVEKEAAEHTMRCRIP